MTTNTNNTNTIITPYHPPTSPSSIHHVALSSKSFRVFGLNDPAWKNARRDWKKYKKNGESGVAKKSDGGGIVSSAGDDTNEKSSGGGGKSMMSGGGKMSSVKGNFDCSDSDSSSDEDGDSEDGDDDSDSEIEEEEELEFICNAITTALADDAGGFGTAGFHVNKADTVQLLSNLDNNNSSPSVFNAKLIPHDAQSKAPLVPSSVLTIDADTGKVKYAENSNDEFYLGGNNKRTFISITRCENFHLNHTSASLETTDSPEALSPTLSTRYGLTIVNYCWKNVDTTHSWVALTMNNSPTTRQ
mmetsp:Transcript_39542/g.71190  ORF Transcript_39542/g.71190 Transcript_39542/m.71190 type:complete len:301 (+) Transcript_39542:107-1009(+)